MDAKTEGKKAYAKLHNAVSLRSVDFDKIEYRVEKLRDASVVIEDGQAKDLEEKWGLVAYYTYPDGKVEKFHASYDALPSFITKDIKNAKYGVKRKIYAKVDRARPIYRLVQQLRQALLDKFMEAFFSIDCSKVFEQFKVSVASGKKIVEVSYSNFIAAKLAESPKVKGIHIEDVEAAFRAKLTTEATKDEDGALMREVVRTGNLLAEGKGDGASPTKFITTTGYPKSPKNDSAEAKERFEIAKEQGSRLLYIWCHPDLRARFLQNKLTEPEAWLQAKSGTSYHTTDYHLMKYVKKGELPWIAFSATMHWRHSFSKDNGHSIVLEEEMSSGTLVDICPSEFTPRSDEAVDNYKAEFASGHASVDESRLARLAQESDLVQEGEEVDT